MHCAEVSMVVSYDCMVFQTFLISKSLDRLDSCIKAVFAADNRPTVLTTDTKLHG